MFGLLRSSGCGLRTAERQAWVAHICGVCLALRRDHGQLARLATNYDAALLSVLSAAQCPTAPVQMRHFCPARRGGSAQVIAADQPGSRYAGTVALLIAATRLADDIADGEGWARLLPGVATRLSQRWQQQAQRVVASPAITLAAIVGPIRQQAAVERQECRDFAVYAAPTEAAVGATFRQTALLAEQPANEAALDRIGQMYGRIIYLLDSYRDYATDRACGRFNALAHCAPTAELPQQARQIFTQAHTELSGAFATLILPQPDLARELLLHQVRRIGMRTLATDIEHPPDQAEPGQSQQRKRKRRADHARHRKHTCCDRCGTSFAECDMICRMLSRRRRRSICCCGYSGGGGCDCDGDGCCCCGDGDGCCCDSG
jgi:hypothetical protein